MTERPREADPSDLLGALLARAEVSGPVRRRDEISHPGATNRTWAIETDQGERFILRDYRWPYQEEEPGRALKEPALHQLLRRHGVPAPEVLAVVEEGGRTAALLEYLPGVLLDEVPSHLPPEERDRAWRSAGEKMRRIHSIVYPAGSSGVILGEDLRPFEAGPWRDFSRQGVIQHGIRLKDRQPALPINVDRLQEVADLVGPHLDQTPSVLLHNDSHPWNVLVHESTRGWECSGWLDWEHAWVGDPAWDLVRMDLFRRKPIGPTPEAFWEGYGAHPPEPRRSFYELQINLWMANQYLDGSRALLPTYRAALSYVDEIDAQLSHLESLVD